MAEERYVARFKAAVVYFANYRNDFKYAFEITDIDDENKRNYLNIIYDREPTLPEKVEDDASVFGEISANIHKRFAKQNKNARKLARIMVEPKYWIMVADSPNIIIPEAKTNIVDTTVVSETQERLADFKTFKTKNQFIGQIMPFKTKISKSSVVIGPIFGSHIREHKKETVI